MRESEWVREWVREREWVSEGGSERAGEGPRGRGSERSRVRDWLTDWLPVCLPAWLTDWRTVVDIIIHVCHVDDCLQAVRNEIKITSHRELSLKMRKKPSEVRKGKRNINQPCWRLYPCTMINNSGSITPKVLKYITKQYNSIQYNYNSKTTVTSSQPISAQYLKLLNHIEAIYLLSSCSRSTRANRELLCVTYKGVTVV